MHACWTANREVRGSNHGQGRNVILRFLLHIRAVRRLYSVGSSVLVNFGRWRCAAGPKKLAAAV